MLSQGIVTGGVALIGSALSLAALWLRLTFQLRGEQERRQYLLTAATMLPAGSQVREQRGDGTQLTLIISAPTPTEETDE